MSRHGKASPYWEAVLMFVMILVAGYTEAAERAANSVGAVTERATNAESIEARRMRLLAMLTSPKMLDGDIDSGSYA